MNSIYDSATPEKEITRHGSRKRSHTSAVGFLLLVLLWCGLVYGGFYLTKNYIDNAIKKVQETNAMNVQEINDRLDTLSADMKGLKEVLSNADETLSTTGSLQKDLNEKIALLEQQMKNLETSLNILKEAP